MAERSDPWPTMTWLGVLCGIAIGAVIVMLLRDRRGSSSELDLALDPGPAREPSFGLPSVSRKPSTMLAQPRVVPVARTVPLGSGRSVMILQAIGARDWTIWVRVLGPPGAEASFMIGNNTGNAITIPAGGFQQMMVPRGEFLYAAGNTSGVSVSVSGGAA